MNATTEDMRGMIATVSRLITAHAAELNRLDAALGDGDHGTAISAGFQAAAEGLHEALTPGDVLQITATNLLNRMGGSSGALYGTLFLRAAGAAKDREALSPGDLAALWQTGCEGVAQRGRAQPGDKTMLDALAPAVDAFRKSVDEGGLPVEMFAAAAAAAEAGAAETAQMQAKHGRARYVGERARGHVDAGAQSIALMFRAMHGYWKAKQDAET